MGKLDHALQKVEHVHAGIVSLTCSLKFLTDLSGAGFDTPCPFEPGDMSAMFEMLWKTSERALEQVADAEDQIMRLTKAQA